MTLLFKTKPTLTTFLLSLFLSICLILFCFDRLHQASSRSLLTLCTLILPAAGVLTGMTLLVAAARAAMVTWITVLVLLAVAGKRRRVLVQQGRKITTDVAIYFLAHCYGE